MTTVTSLETAKKLKAAGYPQKGMKCGIYENGKRDKYITIKDDECDRPCACEILEQLPYIIRHNIKRKMGGTLPKELVNDYRLVVIKHDNTSWFVGYRHTVDEDFYKISRLDNSLAEALSELWLWCKKKEYIK